MSFFIHPCSNYKVTTLKSPMAHKTFSQEQFIIKNYTLSISFYTLYTYVPCSLDSSAKMNLECNEHFFFIFLLKKLMPSFGSNMFFIKKYSLLFNTSVGGGYFHYNKFYSMTQLLETLIKQYHFFVQYLEA